MKRGQPLQRRTPLRSSSSLRSSGSLHPVSRKRAAQNRTYTRLRGEFLGSRPRCEFPGGCTRAAVEVHHKAGRIGALFLDTTRWLPICTEHHRWATEHPAAAIACGASEHRIGAA